ncbi:MAG: spermidine synthase [Bacteroidia bacterium]
MNLKKVFSYFLPLRLKNYPSDVNGNLEINLVNGKKVLDTRSSNYSFGSLQHILERGLKTIAFDQRFQHILVLGMGAGSIVESIRNRFHSNAVITLVDIDPLMEIIAREEFTLERFDDVRVVIMDAEEFLLERHDPFDLILVDLFIIDTIPEKFTQKPFIDLLSLHLNPGGKIIYNSIRKTLPASSFEKIKESFVENELLVDVVKDVDYSNDLILASKNP